MLIRKSHVATRYHLPDLLNTRGFHGDCVEVGTHRGLFAKSFLDRWTPPGRLWCVDPYLPGYDDGDPASYGDRRQDYEKASRLLGEAHPGRFVFSRTTSANASTGFAAGSLDLVYVDGRHRYDSVLEDLLTWWPKVRPGGILAGHDYVCPGEVNDGWGLEVQPAVRDFAAASGLAAVHVIVEPDGEPWGYYFVKGES